MSASGHLLAAARARAAALLARTALPGPGTPLACAVSGGPDSLALLVLAAAQGCEVTAYHVDHGIRPGSAAEARVVEEVARGLGAGFVALRAVVPPGPNLEARARAARVAVLPPGHATGHTADDQAETVLLRLIRGTGVAGLGAMRPGPAHPLLGLRRAETERLCAALGLSPVRDPSNSDPRFWRNRVRREVLPLLADVAGRDVVPLLCRLADVAREESDALEALAAELDPADARALSSAPPALARRALRRWLASQAPPYPPDRAALERVLDTARGRARACEVAGAGRVRRRAGRLALESVR
jgi:tRNA(Ile)-lysidine synthase